MHHVDNPFKNPRIISNCTGLLRGLERGIEQTAGSVRTVAFVEIEAFVIENLLAGMEQGILDAAPIWCNLKTFDARPFRGLMDGIIGGYPCQPFSHAGNRKGTDDPRHLWPFICQQIAAVRPVWCFFENVSGHLSLGFDQVYRDLEGMGYNVESGIFTAEEVGAPHERKRLFILAVKSEYLANSRSLESRRIPKTEGWQQDLPTWNTSKTMSDTRLLGQAFGQEQTSGDEQYGEELANTNSKRHNDGKSQEYTAEGREHAQRDITAGGTEELGNTESIPARRLRCGEEESMPGIPSDYIGGIVADPCIVNVQRNITQQPYTEVGSEHRERPLRPQSGNGWPARPGQSQFHFEEPRTVITNAAARLLGGYGKKYPESFPAWQIEQIAYDGFTGSLKPEMGTAIDGYDFREDLLRGVGNGVVAATAGLAFKTLLEKHGIITNP